MRRFKAFDLSCFFIQLRFKKSMIEDLVRVLPGYTKRIIKPADKPELIAVAKAMHEDQFGEKVQELFAVSGKV